MLQSDCVELEQQFTVFLLKPGVQLWGGFL